MARMPPQMPIEAAGFARCSLVVCHRPPLQKCRDLLADAFGVGFGVGAACVGVAHGHFNFAVTEQF